MVLIRSVLNTIPQYYMSTILFTKAQSQKFTKLLDTSSGAIMGVKGTYILKAGVTLTCQNNLEGWHLETLPTLMKPSL